MSIALPISKEAFVKRITELCLRSGLTGFPKDDLDQQILFKSVVLLLGKAETFTEKQVNEQLEYWILNIGRIKKFDRSSLRRWLVDAGYLTRTSDGSQYRIAPGGPRAGLFEPPVDQIDIVVEVARAQEEIARRKREYLAKSG